MPTTDTLLPTIVPVPPSLPPLEPGDRLSRDEFERRYDAMPHLKKAELIEGVVHIPSGRSGHRHSEARVGMIAWLGSYQAFLPLVEAGANCTLRLDLDNEPQPDAVLNLSAEAGGRTRVDADDILRGAPELVAEVASTTASIELHSKLRVYRRNSVREYVVWRVLDRAIDWFVLHGSQYDRLSLSPAGYYQSEVFPGLWLDPTALTRLDMARVLQVVQQGLASPEHAAFVARLGRAGQAHA